MRTRLYITNESGQTVDLGAAHPPYDGIGTVAELLRVMPNVAHVAWRDPETDYVALAGTRVANGPEHRSFGWRTAGMASWAFAAL